MVLGCQHVLDWVCIQALELIVVFRCQLIIPSSIFLYYLLNNLLHQHLSLILDQLIFWA